jgi:hypothetical protein
MHANGRQRDDAASAESLPAIPAGTPAWVTPELVRHTQKVWEPFYKGAVSVEDAVTILLSVGRLFRVLGRE